MLRVAERTWFGTEGFFVRLQHFGRFRLFRGSEARDLCLGLSSDSVLHPNHTLIVSVFLQGNREETPWSEPSGLGFVVPLRVGATSFSRQAFEPLLQCRAECFLGPVDGFTHLGFIWPFVVRAQKKDSRGCILSLTRKVQTLMIQYFTILSTS